MVAKGTPWVRRINERRIVAELLTVESLSRAVLARRTGLSAPTVGKVVDDLMARGILQEGEASRGRPGKGRALGRPSRPVSLQRTTPRFIAVELSVGTTSLSALPVAGPDPDATWQEQFPTPDDAHGWKQALASVARKMRPRRPWAVLVSVPGVCDERRGRVLLSPNLHWTEEVDLVTLLGEVWKAPVVVVQEIRALALGQLKAGGGDADFLHVDFGTGVGGALVRGGSLYDGEVVLSGELGHTPVVGNRRPCGCGSTGCVETLVSRPGLLASLAAREGVQDARWEDLSERIRDREVEPWCREGLDAMATVIAGALNVTGLTRVVITGSLTRLPGCVVEHLTRRICQGAMWARFGEVHVQAAPRRRAQGLVTAALDRFLLPGQQEP